MKKNKIRNQKWYNNAVAILIGVVAYVALTHLKEISAALRGIGSFFTAVLIGCVIAYLVNPLAVILEKNIFSGIQRRSVRWMVSVIFSMLAVLAVIVVLLVMLVPQLIESISVLISNMDGYIKTLNNLIMGVSLPGVDIQSQLSQFLTSSEDLIKTGTQLLSTSLKSILSASRGIGKNIVNTFLAFILSVYLLGSKDSLKAGCKRLLKALLPDRGYDYTVTFLKRCNNILVRYIIFSILDAAIVGGVNAIFMALAGMQYVGLVSVVVGVTNLIPSFGPVIGGAIGAFILLLVNPWHALLFIGFTMILQTLDGYVIKPKLFGDSLGVSGLLILVSIIVFGNIMGVVGILLSIPLAAIIDFSYEEYLLPYLERRKQRIAEEEAAEEARALRAKAKAARKLESAAAAEAGETVKAKEAEPQAAETQAVEAQAAETQAAEMQTDNEKKA